MFDELFAAFGRPGGPGACVAVLRDGAVVAQASYGLAELEAGRPCGPTTCFRLASVTKQITALAVAQLAERGLLDLGGPVGALLPELPPYARDVTPHQLLTHSSGLADYEECIPAGQVEQVRDADIPALLPADPGAGSYFAPGAGYRYSNTGYVLLALLAERAAGRSFPELLREQIFAPLGMRSAIAYLAGGPAVPERAYGYSAEGGGWLRTDQSVTSATLGDGGVYASAEDMARWLAAWERGDAAGADLLRRAVMPHVARPEGGAYGYGWFIDQRGGRAQIWHDGTTVGFRTAVVRLPELRAAALVLCNRSAAEPAELALAALEQVV